MPIALNNRPKFATIFDLLGKLVCTFEVTNSTVDISNLNNGIYHLVIKSTTHQYAQKIILQKKGFYLFLPLAFPEK